MSGAVRTKVPAPAVFTSMLSSNVFTVKLLPSFVDGHSTCAASILLPSSENASLFSAPAR